MLGLQHDNMTDKTKRCFEHVIKGVIFSQNISEAVKRDLKSRSEVYNAITDMEVEYPNTCEEVMEVEYPDMEKQMDELCLQFEKLSI